MVNGESLLVLIAKSVWLLPIVHASISHSYLMRKGGWQAIMISMLSCFFVSLGLVALLQIPLVDWALQETVAGAEGLLPREELFQRAIQARFRYVLAPLSLIVIFSQILVSLVAFRIQRLRPPLAQFVTAHGLALLPTLIWVIYLQMQITAFIKQVSVTPQ